MRVFCITMWGICILWNYVAVAGVKSDDASSRTANKMEDPIQAGSMTVSTRARFAVYAERSHGPEGPEEWKILNLKSGTAKSFVDDLVLYEVRHSDKPTGGIGAIRYAAACSYDASVVVVTEMPWIESDGSWRYVWRLYVMNAETSEIRRVHEAEGRIFAAWSGDRIAYSVQEKEGFSDIKVCQADGEEVTVVDVHAPVLAGSEKGGTLAVVLDDSRKGARVALRKEWKVAVIKDSGELVSVGVPVVRLMIPEERSVRVSPEGKWVVVQIDESRSLGDAGKTVDGKRIGVFSAGGVTTTYPYVQPVGVADDGRVIGIREAKAQEGRSVVVYDKEWRDVESGQGITDGVYVGGRIDCLEKDDSVRIRNVAVPAKR